jgi:hypothetical protein
MAQANDSILVTPGSGATVATELVGSKEYQAVVRADHRGHIIGGRDVYAFSAVGMTTATINKVFMTVYNADATIIAEIPLIVIAAENTAAVTGLVRGIRVYRVTSAPTGGTTLTAVKLKSASPTIDADIVGRRDGVTATASGDPIAVASFSQEETGGAGGQIIVFSEQFVGEPIVLAQNEGIMVQLDGTAGVASALLNCAVYVRQY